MLITITIFCLSCVQTWPLGCDLTFYICLNHNLLSQLCQNLTSEDVAKTFKTNKQMDKNAAKLEGEGGKGSKWGWYQIRTLHTIQIKWSNMLVGECAIMSIKHRPYKWTTSFHRERLRFLLWIFKWPHDQLNATKLVRVVCKTQKLKDKTYILREFELMVLGHLALTSIFLEKLRDYNCIQSDWEKH